MYFDWRTFLRVLYLTVFKSRLSPAPMSWKRGIFLTGFFLVFPMVQLFNGLCFLIDRLLYPQWLSTPIRRPVFIVGNPRSGTTFIHRVMARDENRFFSFKTWEIIFPAIVQKRLLKRLDRLTGHLLSALLKRVEERLFREFNKMHKVSLFAPEEDDYLFLHIFSAHDLVWLFPFEEMSRFLRFDESLSAKQQKRIMNFYKDCIRRQAFYLGHAGSLLSKAPASSARIASLIKQFPDCRMIYMVRNPLDVIPSMVNLAHVLWASMAGMGEGFPLQDQIYDALKYYYEYPLAFLSTVPDAQYKIVNYEELTSHPARTIEDVYRHFGLVISPAFQNALLEEEHKARHYQSRHNYALEKTHIKRSRIVEDLKDIFDRFGFDRREDLPD